MAVMMFIECDGDGCDNVTTSDSDGFSENWHNGLHYQFCPSCRTAPVNAEKIDAEKKDEKIIAACVATNVEDPRIGMDRDAVNSVFGGGNSKFAFSE